ncbi:MAG: hypothetical protein QF835_01850 [Candidatus Marinimicrobia bacterium]|nr:hypothetical protein [Candidatus Neomarinimicrobiota bacterium]
MSINSVDRGISRIATRLVVLVLVFLLMISMAIAQGDPELETAVVKMNRIWVGVKANGDKGTFEHRVGFFPNDYDILGHRGQNLDTWGGAGFRLSTTNWYDPLDTLHATAIYGPKSDFMPLGEVVDGGELTNWIRFGYPTQTIDFEDIDFDDFGDVSTAAFGDKTFDQIVEVTSRNILGVELNRKVMAWSQNYHDDYVIVDVEFTNVSGDTLHDFYINIASNGNNTHRSNGSNPSPSSEEKYDNATTWQHYYGGRVGDSLRVFYEYSADEPNRPGDDMGAPVVTQGGRLLNAKLIWYSILHASAAPYSDPLNDVDDFLQPKITYLGVSSAIDNVYPGEGSDDEFGSDNYWALAGGYSNLLPMSGDTIPGTFHGFNSDELGSSDYSIADAINNNSNNSKMWCTFGPYTFAPDQKLRIALANGYTGMSLEKAQEIGEQWMIGTLQDPPGLPLSETGYFPANFMFPPDASEMDKIKDRWLSTGIDSVMQSASRAKWNHDTGYRVPAAPPPPTNVEITGLGTGVEIKWTDPEAEARADFAGYRILHRLSNMDTTFYEEIYSSDASDIATEHLYVDSDVLIGGQYYYYIQAKALVGEADANAYPANRGRIIYSGRALQPNVKWINPPHFSQENLNEIAIVPNPYNINDPLLDAQGWTDKRGIQFYNLPAKVDITIYTEHGDLVQSIEHDSPVSSGYEHWNMISRNQQLISSGVYIVVFQTPAGGLSYQKFVVIR